MSESGPPEIKPHWDATKLSQSEMWTQKRRLASAMRLVIERLVPSNAPVDELRRAADALERYAEALKDHPRLRDARLYGESANAGDVGAFFDQSPLIGLANPLAPPLTIGQKDDRHAHATAVFGSAYEGPPGSVHGGFVAAAFDEVLGFVQSLSGHPGMTGTLTVRYRSPTPLHTQLLFEARLDRVEGRKIFTSARLEADGVLCAEAEAIFISFREGGMKKLAEARAAREAKLQQASGSNAEPRGNPQ
ncbi:MAG TPA: PaaI family thioesterase [Deltaproteobacteria bacterium]|nr:PaaI family thioesterase [Deltaproteobacteria bacterium]